MASSLGCCLLGLGGAWGCTTWTSLHGGIGVTQSRNRSLAGLEVRRGLGGPIHSTYGLAGARLDGNGEQFDAELHAGIMRPLRLSGRVSLVPSGTLELGRAGHVDGKWQGGAFGPGLGAELLWWALTRRFTHQSWEPLGCMGGAIGVDCPSGCTVQDVTRQGIGVRVAAEYDLRFGHDYPRQNDWTLWLTLGVTHTVSAREKECCYFYDHQPRRRDCELMP